MSKKKKTILWIVVSILLAIILASAGVYFYFFHGLTPGCILNNVSIAGVDVGGKTPEEASAAVSAAVDEIYAQTMEVFVDPYTVTIKPEIANISLDVPSAVQAAYDYGRVGSYAERKAQKEAAAAQGYVMDTTPYLTLDEAAIRAQLEKFLVLFESELTQTSYEIEGEKPDLTAPIEECIPQTLVITKGTSLFQLDIDELYELVLGGYQNAVFNVVSECTVTAPDELYIQQIYDEYCSDPVDAEMDEKFQISHEVNGYTFDLEAAKKAFEELPEGKHMEVDFYLTAPDVTYQSLYDTLFQDELASYTAYQASNSSRATNLQLACEAIDGLVLLPGETFSFNETVGERTPEKGYKPAAAYVGGESVASYGGGVCQVASTIYYCCLYADMEIVERACHMYPSSYVRFGMDATIYWPTLDYKFKNNWNYPIRIDAVADNSGSVTVHLMGTEEKDYYIDMQYEILGVYSPETKEVEMKADNPDGYKNGDVITSPHTGYFVRTYKYRYSKADNSLIEMVHEADSHYDKRDKEVAKIIDEPAPTEPAPTTPPATEADPTTPPATEPVPTAPPATEPAPTDPPAAEPAPSDSGLTGTVTPDG